MQLVPFIPYHLGQLDPCIPEGIPVEPEVWVKQFFLPGCSMTAWDGRAVACVGLVPISSWRWVAWAVFDRNIGPRKFLQAANLFKHLLNMSLPSRGRIEAYVMEGFEPGRRYVETLGFKNETPNPIDGVVPGFRCYQYAKVARDVI